MNKIRISEKNVDKFYPTLKIILDGIYGNISWNEKIYLVKNELIFPKKCVCGKPLKLINMTIGYHKFCSRNCQMHSDEGIRGREEGMIKKYGTKHAFHVKSIKEKAISTYMLNYGTTNPMKSEKIKEKVRSTVQHKYGKNWITKTDHIKQKIKDSTIKKYGAIGFADPKQLKKMKSTMIDRYGVPNAMMSDSIKEKVFATNLQKYGNKCFLQSSSNIMLVKDSKTKIVQSKFPDVISIGKIWTCKCPDSKCNKCHDKTYQISGNVYRSRLENGSILCTKIHPINDHRSTQEIQICEFLDELEINYVTNIRSIIAPKELDIYIPEKKIAIEVNGAYWHSIKFSKNSSGFDKYESCMNLGIELITIWEDWKMDDIKQFLIAKLEGLDINKYKQLWFKDLKDNEWPCDLGLMSGEHIVHENVHGNLNCYDSGIIRV